MKHKTPLFALIITSLLLVACGESPVGSIQDHIYAQHYDEAIAVAEAELEKKPDQPLLYALAAEARLRRCMASDCFINNNADLENLTRDLSFVPEEAIQTDGQPAHNTYAILLHLAEELTTHQAHPMPLVMLIRALPPSAPKQMFVDVIYSTTLANMRKLEGENTPPLLDSISQSPLTTEGTKTYLRLLEGLIKNTPERITQPAQTFGNNPTTLAEVPSAAIRLLPYAMFIFAQKRGGAMATTVYLDRFAPGLAEMNLEKSLTQSQRQALGDELQTMLTNEAFMKAAARTFKVEGGDAETILPLRLKKLVLVANPYLVSLWQNVLPELQNYVEKTGNINVLTDGIISSAIPASATGVYNETLFALATSRIAKGLDAAPIINRIAIPLVGGEPVVAQINKMVGDALTTAVEKKEVALIISYGSLKPELVAPQKQTIVPLLVEAVRTAWNKNDFPAIPPTAAFLNTVAGVEFNLDSLLIENYEAYLNDTIRPQLIANTPDALLLPPQAAALDLGAKFTFMREHFADTPNVVDTPLKTLIVNAGGPYGPAVALHRLANQFDDTQFTAADRTAYLVGALKSGIAGDKTISATALFNVGQKLTIQYPDLPQVFVMSEALKRLTTADEARTLWKNATPDQKDTFKAVRPQFAALMEAFDAYDAQNRTLAAEKLTLVSDPQYRAQAEPLLKEFMGLKEKIAGLYVRTPLNTQLPTVMIKVESAPATDGAPSLLETKLTFISGVGLTRNENRAELATDFGATTAGSLIAALQPDGLTLPIDDETLANSDVSGNFDKTYGAIRTLTFGGGEKPSTLTVELADNKTSFTFTRVSSNPTRALFPQGRYAITTQLSAGNPATDKILPIGSMLEFSTDESRALANPNANIVGEASVIYPVSGTLIHPGSSIPRTISGTFRADIQRTDVVFSYPLAPNQGFIGALMRCQITPATLLCGAHNQHASRQRYSHVVAGTRIGNIPNLDANDAAELEKVLLIQQQEELLKKQEAEKNAPALEPEASPEAVSPTLDVSPTVLTPSATVVNEISGTMAVSSSVEISPTALPPTPVDVESIPLEP